MSQSLCIHVCTSWFSNISVCVQRLSQALDDKEDEIARLRSKVRETEDALSHARKSAHKANIDNREVSLACVRYM